METKGAQKESQNKRVKLRRAISSILIDEPERRSARRFAFGLKTLHTSLIELNRKQFGDSVAVFLSRQRIFQDFNSIDLNCESSCDLNVMNHEADR